MTRKWRDKPHNSFFKALENPFIKVLWVSLYIVIVTSILMSVYMIPEKPEQYKPGFDTLGEQIRKLQELNRYECE